MFRLPVTGSEWTSTGSAFASPVTVFSDPDPSGNAPLRLYAGTTDGNVYTTTNALPGGPDWVDVSAGLNGALHHRHRAAARQRERRLRDGQHVHRHETVQIDECRRELDRDRRRASGVTTNTVLVDTANAQRVFVGTDIGVYESVDGGANFTPMTLGMPRASFVVDLEIAAVPHVLVAGLYGGGAWKINLAPYTDRIFASGFQP